MAKPLRNINGTMRTHAEIRSRLHAYFPLTARGAHWLDLASQHRQRGEHEMWSSAIEMARLWRTRFGGRLPLP